MPAAKHPLSALTAAALTTMLLATSGCAMPPPGEALRGLVRDTRSADDLLGLSMAVSQGDERWSAASGHRSPGGPAMTPSTPLVVGSVTKLFSATLVMQLVEDGALGLGDTILPWFPDRPDAETITIEDLLSHRTGIPDYLRAASVRGDSGRHWEPRELLAAADAMDTEDGFEVGVDTAYSSTNYLMLGIIVEEVTDRTWEELLEERITGPLGLHDTFVPQPWGQDGALEMGYRHTLRGYDDVYGLMDPSVGWFVGSMASSSEDLDRFARALFSGELVSPATLDEMTIVRGSDSDGEIDIGMGLGIMIVPTAGGTLYGHTGGLDGYTAFLAYDPDTDTVVAANANTEAAPLAPAALQVFDYMAAR